jgi:hypothetical protein
MFPYDREPLLAAESVVLKRRLYLVIIVGIHFSLTPMIKINRFPIFLKMAESGGNLSYLPRGRGRAQGVPTLQRAARVRSHVCGTERELGMTGATVSQQLFAIERKADVDRHL